MLACADGEVAASRTIKAAKYSKWGIYGDRSSGLRVPVSVCVIEGLNRQGPSCAKWLLKQKCVFQQEM